MKIPIQRAHRLTDLSIWFLDATDSRVTGTYAVDAQCTRLVTKGPGWGWGPYQGTFTMTNQGDSLPAWHGNAHAHRAFVAPKTTRDHILIAPNDPLARTRDWNVHSACCMTLTAARHLQGSPASLPPPTAPRPPTPSLPVPMPPMSTVNGLHTRDIHSRSVASQTRPAHASRSNCRHMPFDGHNGVRLMTAQTGGMADQL